MNFRKGLKSIVVLALSMIVMQSCQKQSAENTTTSATSSTAAISQSGDTQITESELDNYTEIGYFKGNWYAGDMYSNVSHSYVLELGSRKLFANFMNLNCEWGFDIPQSEIDNVKVLFAAAGVVSGTQAQSASAATEVMVLRKRDATGAVVAEKIISFRQSNLSLGSYYFSNGLNLSSMLKSLVDDQKLENYTCLDK